MSHLRDALTEVFSSPTKCWIVHFDDLIHGPCRPRRALAIGMYHSMTLVWVDCDEGNEELVFEAFKTRVEAQEYSDRVNEDEEKELADADVSNPNIWRKGKLEEIAMPPS